MNIEENILLVTTIISGIVCCYVVFSFVFAKIKGKIRRDACNVRLVEKIVNELNSLRDDFFVKRSFREVLDSVYECFMDVCWLDFDSEEFDCIIKSSICALCNPSVSLVEMEQYRCFPQR